MRITVPVTVKDGAITIELDAPVGLYEGTYMAEIEIDDVRPRKLTLPAPWTWTNWPADEKFRREDMYDDDGC
jgi:methionine synthase II (cobalamin-independent)